MLSGCAPLPHRIARPTGQSLDPMKPYNDPLAMKFTLAIPSVQVPRAPTIHLAPQLPKIRVPFLSLLLQPKPLKKWLLIWLFCLYLTFCMGCFFTFEQPRLNKETYIRFGADSPTYWEAVRYRGEHAENGSLISFTGNLLGPVTIGVLLQSGLAVAVFNIFLFFISVEIAATIPGVDKYMLVFLLVICSETAAALVTLNKEILVLLSAFIFAKYIYSEKRSWFLLALALVISLFARWEQIGLILIFLFLRRKGSFFARNPKLAVLSVIGVLTVLYGLIARLPGSGLKAFTNYTTGANTIVKLNAVQANFGFPLVLPFKVIMDIMGELLRPLTFFAEFGYLGTGDIHSMFIIPLFSISLIVLLIIAYRQGKLNPRHPLALLMIIFTVMTAVTPFVQPRYLYFVYVLLALELSMKYDPAVPETAIA
jgi:hypothetical protein